MRFPSKRNPCCYYANKNFCQYLQEIKSSSLPPHIYVLPLSYKRYDFIINFAIHADQKHWYFSFSAHFRSDYIYRHRPILIPIQSIYLTADDTFYKIGSEDWPIFQCDHLIMSNVLILFISDTSVVKICQSDPIVLKRGRKSDPKDRLIMISCCFINCFLFHLANLQL